MIPRKPYSKGTVEIGDALSEIKLQEAEFDPEKHPRDEHGRFGYHGTSAGAAESILKNGLGFDDKYNVVYASTNKDDALMYAGSAAYKQYGEAWKDHEYAIVVLKDVTNIPGMENFKRKEWFAKSGTGVQVGPEHIDRIEIYRGSDSEGKTPVRIMRATEAASAEPGYVVVLFKEKKKQNTEAHRPAWGRLKLAFMSDDVASSRDPLFVYGSIRVSGLPRLAMWGGQIKWAESLATARKYAEPDAIPLKAPRRLANSKPFMSGRHIEALTDKGWQPLKGVKGRWIAVESGWVLDGPSLAKWTTRAYRPSRKTLEKFPQLEKLSVREAPRGVSYTAGLVHEDIGYLQSLMAATGEDSKPLQVLSDSSFPRLLERALIGNRGHLLVWYGEAVPSNLEVAVEVDSGKVLYAKQHFPPGTEPVRWRVGVLAEEKGKVWAIRLPESGMWVLPGGHKDPGESRGAAAVREMLEETGIRVRLEGVAGEIHRPEFTTVVFRGKVLSKGQPSTPDEIDQVALIDPHHLDVSEREWVKAQLGQ